MDWRSESGRGQNRENVTSMDSLWSKSLHWFDKQPLSTPKNRKRAMLVQVIKSELLFIEESEVMRCGSILDRNGLLHTTYHQDLRWCLVIADDLYHRDWPTLDMRRSIAAAYGLKFIENMTGKNINATLPLPRWIGEWAIG